MLDVRSSHKRCRLCLLLGSCSTRTQTVVAPSVLYHSLRLLLLALVPRNHLVPPPSCRRRRNLPCAREYLSDNDMAPPHRSPPMGRADDSAAATTSSTHETMHPSRRRDERHALEPSPCRRDAGAQSRSPRSRGVAGYDCVHEGMPFVPGREAEHNRRCHPDPASLSIL